MEAEPVSLWEDSDVNQMTYTNKKERLQGWGGQEIDTGYANKNFVGIRQIHLDCLVESQNCPICSRH